MAVHPRKRPTLPAKASPTGVSAVSRVRPVKSRVRPSLPVKANSRASAAVARVRPVKRVR